VLPWRRPRLSAHARRTPERACRTHRRIPGLDIVASGGISFEEEIEKLSDMVSGVLSITYMQSHAETLENNKVNVSVAVERMDGSAIATYTSLVYLPA